MMIKTITLLILSMVLLQPAFAQKKVKDSMITVPAGAEYKTSSFHQWLWGKNYRGVWATPVRIPVAMLDTLAGGLYPEEAGGGHQTKSLKLKSKDGKEYTLRSVNKTLGKVLPENFQETFIEDMTNDKVSMSFPYAASAVAYMAEKVGVYHTNPVFVYLPKQPIIDSYPEFGDQVYLFEQKLGGSWEDAKHLGNFSKFHNTDEVVEELLEDSDHRVDQKMFARSRLFDMIINDWDRHEDQWEWGVNEGKNFKIYQPVPKDRDQAFFSYNGFLLKLLVGASGLKYFQPFQAELKSAPDLSWEQRNLDRFFANELDREAWQKIAKELQAALTDEVIENALKQMPPEIVDINKEDILKALKGRRDGLLKTANEYYTFIAKEVDIPGSEKKEIFEVTRLDGARTQVTIFAFDEGERIERPLYKRVFTEEDTKEVRLYGIDGDDVFKVNGNGDNDIRIRLIGGFAKDTYSIAKGVEKVSVYDDKKNEFDIEGKARMHFSNDSSIHKFQYRHFNYDKKGLKPVIFFNNDDRLFVGLMYNLLKHSWRKEPFAAKHSFAVNYSISQKAFSTVYSGYFPQTFGKAGLALSGSYDAVRWTNFFGLGNESKFVVDDIDYYRARSEEWNAGADVVRNWKHQTLSVGGTFRSVRVIHDNERFTGKVLAPSNPSLHNVDRFAGVRLQYFAHAVDDSIVPEKGATFKGYATYQWNVEKPTATGKFGGVANFYVPLFYKFSLGIRVGGETVTGQPEFYQYASTAGSQTIRGFRTNRFWGKSAFFNSNELRFISKVKSYLYKGKLGLIGFYDHGRVWLPGEDSNTWHSGYGAGILLAPFDILMAEVTYATSKEQNRVQLRLMLPIK